MSGNIDDLIIKTIRQIVIAGSKVVLNDCNKNQSIEYKTDSADTPVTATDKKSARVMINLVKTQFPTHSINEEEYGYLNGEGYQWYIDPLDGTASFARNQKYSTVGVCVYKEEGPFVACICNPFERELIFAEKGKGAFSFNLNEELEIMSNGRKIYVSDKSDLNNAMVYIDGFFNKNNSNQKLEAAKYLIDKSGNRLNVRMVGSNIDQQRHIATGRAEMSLTDSIGGFFDVAAGAIIIEEAGGRFTDLEGNPISKETKVAIGTNGVLHNTVLEIFQPIYKDYPGFK